MRVSKSLRWAKMKTKFRAHPFVYAIGAIIVIILAYLLLWPHSVDYSLDSKTVIHDVKPADIQDTISAERTDTQRQAATEGRTSKPKHGEDRRPKS